MISTEQLAQLLVEHYSVKPGEIDATLLAEIILDDHERTGANRTLRETVDLARGAYPMFFNTSNASSSRSTASDDTSYNPWRADSNNITMQAKITAENPALAAKLKAAAQ